MKYMILIASLIVQICLGGLYAWTTFVPALKSDYALSTTDTQTVFGVLIAIFTLTMVFAGRVLEARGPRPLLILSGILFAAGYVLASFSNGSFLVLLLGISVIVGVATGFGYVCPLSACMKWFPEHKGLVTGISVAGFGGGAMLLASVAEPLLEHGVDVLVIFRWVGIVYGLAIVAAGTTMRFPPGQGIKAVRLVALDSPLAWDPFFWALTCAMFCGTFAGLMVIGNLMPIALDSGLSPTLAAVGISVFALGNAVGRVTWGRVVDKKGSASLTLSLFFLALALGGLLPASSNVAVFIVVSLLIGFGFGSCFVIHAVLVASHYGPERVGSVYPLIFLAYGAAGITGPIAGGWLFDLTGSYFFPIGVSITVVAFGLVVANVLMRRVRMLHARSLIDRDDRAS